MNTFIKAMKRLVLQVFVWYYSSSRCRTFRKLQRGHRINKWSVSQLLCVFRRSWWTRSSGVWAASSPSDNSCSPSRSSCAQTNSLTMIHAPYNIRQWFNFIGRSCRYRLVCTYLLRHSHRIWNGLGCPALLHRSWTRGSSIFTSSKN